MNNFLANLLPVSRLIQHVIGIRDQGRKLGEREPTHVEVGERALGVRSPECVAGYLDGSERIVFRAGHGVRL